MKGKKRVKMLWLRTYILLNYNDFKLSNNNKGADVLSVPLFFYTLLNLKRYEFLRHFFIIIIKLNTFGATTVSIKKPTLIFSQLLNNNEFYSVESF